MANSTRDRILNLIFADTERSHRTRFIQDFPIQRNVWVKLFDNDFSGVDVLLTPNSSGGISKLMDGLFALELDNRPETALAFTESHAVVRLSVFELFELLPLTVWWKRQGLGTFELLIWRSWREDIFQQLAEHLSHWIDSLTDNSEEHDFVTFENRSRSILTDLNLEVAFGALTNLVLLATALVYVADDKSDKDELIRVTLEKLFDATWDSSAKIHDTKYGEASLWSISLNRSAEHAVSIGRKTVKADSAQMLFNVDARNILWAVIDSGIDASHPAFLDSANATTDQLASPLPASRVVETFDFSRLRELMSDPVEFAKKYEGQDAASVVQFKRSIKAGRNINWALLEQFLRVPHNEDYLVPTNGHGTHVAGVIGSDWRAATYVRVDRQVPGQLVDGDVVGVCPSIRMIDLRVFDSKGAADEFSILGALQYIRYRNSSRDKQELHGVNLSLSLWHDIENFGCGVTPICLEVNRATAAGVVVVVAAGNYGFERSENLQFGGGYRAVSITDPGNAASAITVGSTHRSSPHSYGISYFSSRGPTGDGRKKPDLVAPGEKIRSVIPGEGAEPRDGTSMAAPHVSGVAALLLARNEELIGNVARVKEILCNTATDIGREPHFQGFGLVDALRALQNT